MRPVAQGRPPGQRAPSRARSTALTLLTGGSVLGVAAFLTLRGGGGPTPADTGDPSTPPAYAGSVSCRACHPEAFRAWKASHHALAERCVDPSIDAPAFDPPRSIAHGSQSSEAWRAVGGFRLATLGPAGTRETFPLERVIGVAPLRQFLVPAPRGRLQVTELAFDPARREWFDVFGDEDRRPGEWGHWTGRGMTWNAMCAACHNTHVVKGYDPARDEYTTTMAEQGVACEACHGPMARHVARPPAQGQGGGGPRLRRLDAAQTMAVCASCHSRRVELTGAFVAGEDYLDHYAPVLPDDPGAYHADGQVREEAYEYVSFLGSRMHAARVTCVDCHDAHTAKTRGAGNAVCLACHGEGRRGAIRIDAAAHGHHPPDAAGGRCADCHMPVTVYMQRHPRRDHGFTSPDPWLTRQHGVPNACTRCHADRPVPWAEEWVGRWYGRTRETPARRRAVSIARARAGAPTSERLELARRETNPLWRAVAVGLLQGAGPEADEVLTSVLDDPSPLVRGMAARAAAPRAGAPSVASSLRRRLSDPVRLVRIEAARALGRSLDPTSRGAEDLRRYLNHNEDEPAGALAKAFDRMERGENAEAVRLLRRAVSWDPAAAPLHQALALALGPEGQAREAVTALETARRLDPQNADYRFHLGVALQDAGEPARAVEELREAVRLEPSWAEAWYRLAHGYLALGRIADAREAARRARAARSTPPHAVP